MTPDNENLADLGVVSIPNMPTDGRLQAAFPKLTAAQISALETFGEKRSLRAGETVWQAGTIELLSLIHISEPTRP